MAGKRNIATPIVTMSKHARTEIIAWLIPQKIHAATDQRLAARLVRSRSASSSMMDTDPRAGSGGRFDDVLTDGE